MLILAIFGFLFSTLGSAVLGGLLAITYGMRVAFKLLFLTTSTLIILLSVCSPRSYLGALFPPEVAALLIGIVSWLSIGLAIGVLLRRAFLRQW